MNGTEGSDTVGSSTDALISPDYLHSTGSLVHKDFNELLRKQDLTGNLVEVPREHQAKGNTPEELLNGIFEIAADDMENANVQDNYSAENYNSISENFDELHANIYGGNIHIPILQRLYNMIQVFLLRHGLTLDFLTIFQRYVNLLGESNVDVLQDKYLLNLQNELSKGYDFSTILQDIITAFLLKPENVIMKLAYFQFKTERLLLKKVFSSWQLKCSLNYNLSELEEIWNKCVKKKFFQRWVQTSDIKCREWVKNGDEVYNQRLKTGFFDAWLDRIHQIDTKSQIADNFFLDNTFANIKAKHERLTQCFNRTKNVNQKHLLQKSFKLWKLKMCEGHYNPTTMKRYLLCKGFTEWKKKYAHEIYLRELATFSERNFHLSPFLNKWISQYQKKEAYELKLIEKSNIFIKRRFFEMILLADKLVNVESKVQECNTESLQRYVLYVWQKRFEERTNSHDYVVQQNTKIVRFYFSQWKLKSESYATANSHYTSLLKKKFIHSITLKCRAAQFNSSIKEAKYSKALKLWRKKFELNALAQEFDSLILKRYYNVVKNKQHSLKDLGNLSARCYDNDISKRHFMVWINRYKLLLSSQRKAEVFMKLRFITIIKRSINDTRMKTRLSIELSKGNSKKLVENLWKVWKTRLESKRLLNLEMLLDKFEDRRSLQFNQKFLSAWMKRSRFYTVECASIAEQSSDMSSLKNTMLQWTTKYSNIKLMHTEAAEIHDSISVSNAFDSILRKLEALQIQDSRLSMYVEEKQVKLLLKWTNKWSVKVLKLKRNEESVAMFRVRWNRANLRAIMSLWKEKAFSIVNYSSGNELASYSPQNDELTFQTPMKSPNNAAVTIPGSTRVKRNKMDRIRNRFSRARGAIPSPIKTTNVLDSTVKARLSDQRNTAAKDTTGAQATYLLSVNKRLAGKTRNISFNKIPETSLFGFPSPQPFEGPDPDKLKVDLDFLEGDSLPERDDSPTRRRSRPIQ